MRNVLGPRLVLITLVTLVCTTAGAQGVRFWLGALSPATAPAGASFGVRFEALRVEGGTATLDVRYAGAPQIGLALSTSRAFGPIGNVVFDAWGALRTDGSAEGRLGARGVLGPVAVRFAVAGFGPDRLLRQEALTASDRPDLASAAFGVQAGVTWRPNRDLVVEVAPEVYLAGGVALRGEARLRWLRALGDDELFAVVLGYAPPGLGTASAGGGVGLTLTRGRAPDWTFVALVGASRAGVAVGGRASLVEDLGPVRVSLDAAYEPFRLDLRPLRVHAAASAPAFTGGTWELAVDLGSDLGVSSAVRVASGTAYAASVGLSMPLSSGR
ncbi:MAG: hypothetical protein IT345_07045 [Trueperaceae bacterium]|nr:hypothetical protein [Trueperaceae bacterium]